jgi:hypothetical protein
MLEILTLAGFQTQVSAMFHHNPRPPATAKSECRITCASVKKRNELKRTEAINLSWEMSGLSLLLCLRNMGARLNISNC